jgi:hypothetical protein
MKNIFCILRPFLHRLYMRASSFIDYSSSLSRVRGVPRQVLLLTFLTIHKSPIVSKIYNVSLFLAEPNSAFYLVILPQAFIGVVQVTSTFRLPAMKEQKVLHLSFLHPTFLVIIFLRAITNRSHGPYTRSGYE